VTRASLICSKCGTCANLDEKDPPPAPDFDVLAFCLAWIRGEVSCRCPAAPAPRPPLRSA
jgi:hypothetical protein